jgi:mannosylglycerate hydrolase
LRYLVVPHTHWDREWYLPFEHFRFQLARTVDGIIDLLEADPASRAFTLDGQAVVLEDYLEIRPERADRLRALVRAGRVAIGPWYTLPDEYLVGQEALVRNLLAGRRACAPFGRPIAAGYLPDTFGHVAQLPQILRGFGLDNIVFWRGLGDEGEGLGAAFRWRGPDGTEVLAVRILGGYGNADRLGRGDPDAAAARVRELTERFGEKYRRIGLDEMPLWNGNDHRPIQPGLPGLLAACAERLPGSSFRIGTVEDVASSAREAAGDLRTIEGELCGGYDIAVLRGVNSSRMWIKQENEAAERELYAAEALSALATLAGAAYPTAELRAAWRELLRNHPHDSICGCSVDETHHDMRQRFATARSIAHVVRRTGLAALAGQGPPWTYRPLPAAERSVVNLLAWPRRRLVELELPDELRRRRRLVAEVDGTPAPVQLEAGRALLALDVPGFGATKIRLAPSPPGRTPGLTPSPARAVGDAAIESDRLRVEVARNGTLAVTDLATGATAAGLHLLEDQADRGDEYNFCPLERAEPWTSRDLAARVRVIRHGPVVAELEVALDPRLPRALRSDRSDRTRASVACPVRTRVRLVAGIDRVELVTTVGNRARDHRLRVLFPAPASSSHVRVEGHFAVLRRPAQPVWNGRWSEPPQTTHHTLGMVAAGRLALFTRGLPEYEALPRPDGSLDLALTLLRCVGWLSRGDLSTRSHHAGPALETPGAQSLGPHVFGYALGLRGEASDADLVRAAHDYRFELEPGPAGADPAGALRLDGHGFAVSALKAAEDGDGLVLRAYNPGGEPSSLGVRAPSSRLSRCRMDETGAEPVDGPIALGPYEVVTVRIRPGRGSR